VTFTENEGSEKARSGVRKDIQALRAIAVALVVVFHLFPKQVPGGFVGVDAFFVISGYLITSHLWREIEATGRVEVARFWAARARRLLPASFLVLLSCLVATVLLVPVSAQERFLEETLAALLYGLNWKLAVDAVDYWAAEEAASAVQHFWSLAVEEQFYLVWPLLFVLAVALRGKSSGRRTALALVLLVFTVTLALSVRSGFRHDPADYFRTWNRAWEFAVGGLIALRAAPATAPVAATALSWLGVALTIGAAWLLPTKASFPGYWALVPVLGTALTLWFGAAPGKASVSRVLGVGPVQWVGNASYAIYLWHWPLIVFYKLAFEQPIDAVSAAGLVLATCLLSALTKVSVEDRLRYHPFLLSRPPRVTFAMVTVGMLALASGSIVALRAQAELTDTRHHLVKTLRSKAIPCFGGNALPGCSNPLVAGQLLPSPAGAKMDRGKACMADNEGETKIRTCPRGAKKGVKTTTALVGDSHAAHLLPLLQFGAHRRGERILQYLKGSCPFSAHARDTDGPLRKACEGFKRKVRQELASKRDITRVVMSASAGNDLVVQPEMGEFESAVLGYQQEIDALPSHVREVVVVRDVPRMRRRVVECLERLGEISLQLAPGACARERETALLPDPLAEAARRMGGRVHVVDFTDALCDAKMCAPVVHNALAYRDSHHLTETFALSLVPRFALELERSRAAQRDRSAVPSVVE